MKQRLTMILMMFCLSGGFGLAGAQSATAQGCATPRFVTKNYDPHERFISSFTTGDFNSDGKLDLAATSTQNLEVLILFGDGTGGFSNKRSFSFPEKSDPSEEDNIFPVPIDITTGDFNADGKLDLATANSESNDVSVLLGNGAGDFPDGARYDLGLLDLVFTPNSIVTGDFNADGKLDLATASANNDANISILYGNGAGDFEISEHWGELLNAVSLTAGDFNSDGLPDLATAGGNSRKVSVLINQTDFITNFSDEYVAATDNNPFSITTGDFNLDGKLDLATGNKSSTSVSILLGNGAGDFSNQTSVFDNGDFNIDITTGDFNADGKLDLATVNSGSNDVSVLLGNGAGGVAAATYFSLGIQPLLVTTGDFNGDGKLDIAAVKSDFTVSILLNTCGGLGSPPPNPDSDNDGIPDVCDVDSNPSAADIDRDGIVDSSACDTQIGPPVDTNQCKNGGWQLFNIPRMFSNQGDCIQFVNTGR